MQSINAKVKYPCDRDYESKQPGAPNYTTLKVDIAGREERVFLNDGTPEYVYAKSLRKGESVLLGEDKGKYKLIITNTMSDAVATVMTTAPEQPKALTKGEMKAKALTYCELYREIYTDLVLAMPPEQAQLGATAVFNQLSRLFS